MAYFGITKAFAHYGATLRNRMWSVSAWNAANELVVSQWQHHSTPRADASVEFTGSTERWGGHGKKEFRDNIERALAARSPVRLVLVTTKDAARVESGEDASQFKKTFSVRPDLVGQVTGIAGDRYVIRFRPN